jgi:hypothetical protein
MMVGVLGACGHSGQAPSADGMGAEGDVAADRVPAGDAGGADEGGGTTADLTVPPPSTLECQTRTDALAREIDVPEQGCAAVVRLAYDTDAPTTWTLFCGPYVQVTEGAARATAQSDPLYSHSLAAPDDPGKTLDPGDPRGLYVFYQEPDDYGHFAVVSAETGQALLGGDLVWTDAAHLVFPADWRHVEELGSGCAGPPAPVPRIYDFAMVSPPLTLADVDLAVNAVARTALFAAFYGDGLALPQLILVRLQRTLGSNFTSTSEWLVIVLGGTVPGGGP